jgi:hypothetical protein
MARLVHENRSLKHAMQAEQVASGSGGEKLIFDTLKKS